MSLFMRLLIWCIIFNLSPCFTQCLSLKPEKVLIATIIDPNSAEIVRDALSLIRSIRLFGGSLNKATFVAAVAVDGKHAFVDEKLISQLYELQVTISFIPQTAPGLARTLNKFEAFALFDPLKYDYFLWLDADIIVFSDPMPYLRLHKYPGEIECVPDIYSYTRRYPLLNTTSVLWNPSLPPFILIGENEMAPHGTCNTGVLLFDSMSLQSFLNGLHLARQDEFIHQHYGKDRFVDSLYFIHAVHSQGISVSIMPFRMNYMAFFEVELMDDTSTSDIIFGHFLSDTALYCIVVPVESDGASPLAVPSTTCKVVYENKNIPHDSLVLKHIEALLPLHVCRVMAGEILPSVVTVHGISTVYSDRDTSTFDTLCSSYSADAPAGAATKASSDGINSHQDYCIAATGTTDGSDMIESLSVDNSLNVLSVPYVVHIPPVLSANLTCQLVWPSVRDHMETITYYSDEVNIHTAISFCGGSDSGDTGVGGNSAMVEEEEDGIPRHVTVRYVVSGVTCEDILPLHDRVSTEGEIHGVYVYRRLISLYCSKSARIAQERQLSRTVLFDSTLTVVLPDSGSSTVNISSTLQFHLDNSNSSGGEVSNNAYADLIPVKLRIFIVPTAGSSHQTLHLESLFTVRITSRHAAGQVAYSRNLLLGSHQIALESQLQLPQYLNSRHITGAVGVVHCCDTVKGVEVTRRLVEQWHGDTLIIIITASPPLIRGNLHTDEGIQGLVAIMTQSCDDIRRGSELAKCVISTSRDRSDHALQLVRYLGITGKQQSLSFVYLDVRPGVSNTNSVARGYAQYLEQLHQWYNKLSVGGMLMGTRFHKQVHRSGGVVLQHNESKVMNYNQSAHIVDENIMTRAALDYFAYSTQLSYLITYGEGMEDNCDITEGQIKDYECKPAWYVYKPV